MVRGEVSHGSHPIGERVTSACTLLFQSSLKPVGAKLQRVLRLYAMCVASQVLNERVKGRHVGGCLRWSTGTPKLNSNNTNTWKDEDKDVNTMQNTNHWRRERRWRKAAMSPDSATRLFPTMMAPIAHVANAVRSCESNNDSCFLCEPHGFNQPWSLKMTGNNRHQAFVRWTSEKSETWQSG